ncbi:hypothetical protein PAF17_13675 [Paracoccus sp. Z330]|uniref:Uncharacterized protein n=1 Tax=Paracoccus onchidii TaxID=3017813 RepID=A0ABT4ZIG2_9RHOB|nr:hypothetical protein [Paracoccus onchidii]MDB6178546.1 hypothetical protein [Paracoccus onchidii]
MSVAASFEFLVLEKDHFVAADMQGGLAAAMPGCTVLHFLKVKDVIDHIRTSAPLSPKRHVFVTKLGVEQIDALDFALPAGVTPPAIVTRMGDDPDTIPARPGWFSLPSPFTQEDLHLLARHLLAQNAAA